MGFVEALGHDETLREAQREMATLNPVKKNTGDENEARSIRAGWTVEATASAQPATGAAETVQGSASASSTRAPEVESQGVADTAVELTDEASEGAALVADAAAADPNEGPKQMSSIMLVVLGLVGGIYIFYAWVTLTWVQAYAKAIEATVAGSGAIGAFLQQTMYWLAPLGAIMWFITALMLYRKQPIKLIIALVLGLIVLVPVPFLFSIGVAL